MTDHICKTCHWAEWPAHPKKRGNPGACTCPMPELPAMPRCACIGASRITTSDILPVVKVHRLSIWKDDLEPCPTWKRKEQWP